MPTGLPMPHWPEFSLALARDVLPSAFTIAFLAGIEALLSAVGRRRHDRLSSPLRPGAGRHGRRQYRLGGLRRPAGHRRDRPHRDQRPRRRADAAGRHAATPYFCSLFLLLAGDLIAFVPMATLAAVLLMVAWGMSEAGRFRSPAAQRPGERALLLLTFLLTILVDLTVAIGVGVTLAALLFMRRMSEHAGLVAGGSGRGARATGPAAAGRRGAAFHRPDLLRRGQRDDRGAAPRRPAARARSCSGWSWSPISTRPAPARSKPSCARRRGGGTEVWLCGMQRQPLDFLARMTPSFAGARRALTYEGTLRRLALPSSHGAMSVLLTGSSGWLGRFLAPRLRQEGHEVVGLDVAPGRRHAGHRLGRRAAARRACCSSSRRSTPSSMPARCTSPTSSAIRRRPSSTSTSPAR